MANLDFIRRLNKQYEKKSAIGANTKMIPLNEAIDQDKIEKALSNSLTSLGIAYTRFFDLGLPADVVLMFIDVCDFSTRFSNFSGDEISSFFDKYYDIIIPVIYEFGGEVDKIVGDGIICVFGPPFDNSRLGLLIEKANICAKKIILATCGTRFSSKVAFHSGRINYFKNKTGLYKEFTMVGRPLTELFRLESVSINERINYYHNTPIQSYYKRVNYSHSSAYSNGIQWLHHPHDLPSLKGVDYAMFHSIEKV